MSATRACNGVIQVGPAPTTVGELTAWGFTETAAEIDDSSMGDCTSSSQAGPIKTTGSMTVNWDSADGGQDLLVVGTFIAMEVNPQGLTAGKEYQADSVLILSRAVSAEVNGVITGEYNYTINGKWVVTDN